jgi:hypothetical protein
MHRTFPMLIVGQRTNVKNVSEQQASTHENIMKISKTGKLFTAWGEDYFITFGCERPSPSPFRVV